LNFGIFFASFLTIYIISHKKNKTSILSKIFTFRLHSRQKTTKKRKSPEGLLLRLDYL